MVINPEIDQHTLPRLGIELTRNNDDRSRLSATEVAASALAGNQRDEQPPMERPFGLGESIPHRFRNAGGGHHIGLAAEAIALDVASPWDRVGASECRYRSVSPNDSDLSLVSQYIPRPQLLQS